MVEKGADGQLPASREWSTTVTAGSVVVVGQGPATSDPAPAVADYDTNAQFIVTATGTSPTYQWQYNGGDISDGAKYSGTLTDTLTVQNCENADEGNFRCVVTALGMTDTSENAALTVNDPVITGQPVSDTVNPGDPASFTVTAAGTAPVTYQWRKGGVDIADATLATYDIPSASEADEDTYLCRVNGVDGDVDSNSATLTVLDPATVDTDPVSITVDPGDSPIPTFSITASGDPVISYQWRKNGGAIVDGPTGNGSIYSGTATASLDIASIQEGDEGSYDCQVDNSVGQDTSAQATLSVNNPPSIVTDPLSQTVDYQDPVHFSVTASGTAQLSYQWRVGGLGGDIPGATLNTYDIPSASFFDDGVYDCVVTNSAGTATSAGANLEVNDPLITDQPDGVSTTAGDTVQFIVVADGTLAGVFAYQWHLVGVGALSNGPTGNGSTISGATAATLQIASVMPGDEGDYYCRIDDGTNPVLVSLTANLEVGDPAIVTHPLSQTVDPGTPVTFSVVAGGTSPYTYQWRNDGVDITGATEATYNIPSAQEIDEANSPGYTCYIVNSVGDIESNAAVLSVNDPPVIHSVTVDPPSGNPNHGNPFSLVLTLSASSPVLTYQWRKDAVDILDATETAYVVSSAAEIDEGDYTCYVENSAGNATSVPVTIVVGIDFAFGEQPQSQLKYVGENVSFSVTMVGGVLPYSYQWYDDSKALLPGETDETLNITNVQLPDAATYSCEAGDSSGGSAITSDNATLGVALFPNITQHPASAEVQANDSHAFTVAVEGGFLPLTYQWKKNGGNVGPNSPTYNMASVVPGDAGVYDVEIADSNTAVITSNTALLTVTGSAMPVLAGLAALGLLAGVFAVGGAMAIRRRK